MYILGINEGHLATACLLENGALVAAASEERFVRIKGYVGWPSKAIEYCLSRAGIDPAALEEVVLLGNYAALQPHQLQSADHFLGGTADQVYARAKSQGGLYGLYVKVEPSVARFKRLERTLYDVGYHRLGPRWKRTRIRVASRRLGIEESKITTAEHHLSHALSAVYSSRLAYDNADTLVLTCDGEGDTLSATVNIFSDGKLRRISSTHLVDSLGNFYSSITEYLGMRALEHEYKVMGLAPYAPSEGLSKAFNKIQTLIAVNDDLQFVSAIHSRLFQNYFKKCFSKIRFDYVAAAAQKLTEDLLLKWVSNAVRKTGIRRIAAAGGVFLNVKANMRIAALDEVEQFFVMPSPGDDTAVIGSAYAEYLRLTNGSRIEPLGTLYLGPRYSDKEVESDLEGLGNRVRFEKASPDEIAELIAEGEIVARFDGDMELGARALGNRSILCDASKVEKVEKLNRAVKNRDFWMPFAPTITDKHAEEYILNPPITKVDPEYMIFSFESSERARIDLPAAMHPSDKTLRPQVLHRDWNPNYYDLIQKFADLTGRNGLLNTSFNLHGEPIVCTPADAVRVLLHSDLQHLVIGDYLVRKRGVA